MFSNAEFISYEHIVSMAVAEEVHSHRWVVRITLRTGTPVDIETADNRKRAVRAARHRVHATSMATGDTYLCFKETLWLATRYVVRAYVDTEVDGDYVCLVEDILGRTHEAAKGDEDGCETVLAMIAKTVTEAMGSHLVEMDTEE